MAGTLVEQYWGVLIERVPEHYLTTFGTFVAHETMYFGFYIPFLLMDMIPFFKRWKIQEDIVNTPVQHWDVLKKLMMSHVLIQLPLMMLFHWAVGIFGIRTGLPLPAWSNVLGVCVISILIEDFYFYWIHRFLHWGFMYKAIHKMHHKYQAPFGIAAEYAHPVETIILGFGTSIGPMLFADHVFSMYFYLAVRLFQTIECHTGYDFPWSLNNLYPLWGGADFHDHHHKAFNGNYASSIIFWDAVFGTDGAYRSAREAKQKTE